MAALRLNGAVPVRIAAENYCDTDMVFGWNEIPKGKYVQGCLIDQGVFGVLESKVKLVEKF